MASKNVKIDLDARTDASGQTYYIGKCDSPITIDCKEGVVFMIFISEKGDEQLQIAPMKKKRTDYDSTDQTF